MNEKGQTLIEVLIGVVLIALVFLGLFQALSVGIWGTHLNDQLTTAQQIAQSEIEYIKSQGYLTHDENGDPVEGGYLLISLDGEEVTPTFSNGTYSATGNDLKAPSFDVAFSISPVTFESVSVDTEVLQQITMTVTYPGGRPLQVLAFKANVGYGILPLCTQPVDVGRLNPGQGHYYVASTDADGPISAYWAVEESLNIAIYIYEGLPFGSGQGKSNTAPSSLTNPVIAYGDGEGVASTPSYTVPAGDYTVYFYNTDAKKKVNTVNATVTYMCSED